MICTRTGLIETLQRQVAAGTHQPHDTLLVTIITGADGKQDAWREFVTGLSDTQREQLKTAQGDLLRRWQEKPVKTYEVLFGIEGWGRGTIEAISAEEAQEKFDNGEWDVVKDDYKYTVEQIVERD